MRLARGLALACCLLLAGCATGGSPGPGARSLGKDPLEPINRAVYQFNDTFDRHVGEPVARAWVDYVPTMVRTGVHNFFGNLDDVLISANNLLQGKVYEGVSDFMRVVVNTTVGLGGLLDVASEARLEKHNEDLGQTLAVWGVPDGPYLVLPFLGPSTLRDAPATLASVQVHPFAPATKVADPEHWRSLYNPGVGLYLTDMRASALEVGALLDSAALDRYRFMRDAWLQRRHNLIHDGNLPPALPTDDEDEGDDDLPAAPPVRDNSGADLPQSEKRP